MERTNSEKKEIMQNVRKENSDNVLRYLRFIKGGKCKLTGIN